MKNMGNKKHIVVAALLAMLTTGIGAAVAGSSNSLLQMDVKKSSQVDSVDVTFYTTSPAANSIVTRKSNNRYVVLLPNTDSNGSIVPGLGGVKDLVSDIDVKHVNDGIGGYTKVTFTTTKPINIKTYMKKTNPLTQAQKDYKDIIAKNDVGSINLLSQQKSQQAVVTTQNSTTQNSAPSTTVEKSSTPVKAQDFAQKTVQKLSTANNNLKLVNVNPELSTKSQIKPVSPAPVSSLSFSNVNEIKVSNVTKPATTQTPVKTNMDTVEPVKTPIETVEKTVVKDTSVEESVTPVENNTKSSDAKNAEKQFSQDQDAKEKLMGGKFKQIPNWMLFAGVSILGLLILRGLLVSIARVAYKNRQQLAAQYATGATSKPRQMSDYDDIVNSDSMNWQEKYKRYNEKEESLQKQEAVSEMSFVADVSNDKKPSVSEVGAGNLEKFKINSLGVSEDKKLKLKKQISMQSGAKNMKKVLPEEEFKNQMHSKISELEHSLAQVVSVENIADNSNKYKSEDDSIIDNISKIKLKSFSKPVSLKQANRNLIEDNKINSRNKSYKEGRFVKLKNSPLSVTRRNSAAVDLNVSDLINTGSKYLMNNGEMKMNKEKENYLLSSLDEYLSILDGEQGSSATMTKSSVADSLAQIKSSSVAMSRSGVTNPISKASNTGKAPASPMNGLIVKSGYNIDAEKGIYLVNLGGVSALIGRIDESIFVLKKFDSVVEGPLQVRQDDANVYIVKAGRYKCLVDVSKDSMGTLIEI